MKMEFLIRRWDTLASPIVDRTRGFPLCAASSAARNYVEVTRKMGGTAEHQFFFTTIGATIWAASRRDRHSSSRR